MQITGSFPNRPDGLSPEQRALLNVPFRIPPGYGMKVLSKGEQDKRLASLEGEEPLPFDILNVWEPPRKGFLYVVAGDISSGAGLDNSVIDVLRVGTIREPDEQVAQFVTNTIDESDLAYVMDSIGRLYKGRDGQFALLAPECNGLGMSTLRELQKHIGYPNLYIWQYMDTTEGHEFTNRVGWWTTQRTRPIMLQTYRHSVKTVDPHTGLPDYRINSPLTIQELGDFQSPGPLWMAAAAEGAHDDAIMAGAISIMMGRTLQESTRETVHETRRRLGEEAARVKGKQDLTDRGISYQTTDTTYGEMMGNGDDDEYEYVDPNIVHYR